jgi:hypothetical protein
VQDHEHTISEFFKSCRYTCGRVREASDKLDQSALAGAVIPFDCPPLPCTCGLSGVRLCWIVLSHLVAKSS